jgi:hypothetical protein
MKLEVNQYWPTRRDVSVEQVKRRLPRRLCEELIDDYGIQVESSKREVISRLEAMLQLGARKQFVKYHHVEVSKSEIDQYTHFFIVPRSLDWTMGQVLCEMSPPVCTTERCPWGVEIASSVKVKERALDRADLCGIGGPPRMSVHLVISTELHALFEGHGVTGLECEPCGVGHNESGAYVGRVVRGGCQTGIEIFMGSVHCEEHRTIIGALVADLRTPAEKLVPDDFQTLDRVVIGSREFFPPNPPWVVSRRVLKLLLQYRIRGLTAAGWFLKQKFRPLVTS